MTPGAQSRDSLLDALPAGFVSFADDGTIRVANATLAHMLGSEHEAMIGRHVETIFNVGSRIFYQTHLFPLLRMHGHADEIFVMLHCPDAEDEGALMNAVRRERNGEWVTDCVLICVRERRKFEDALIKARKDADVARAEVDAHRAELEAANAVLERQALELELSQQQLLEQAEELEVQSEELKTINDELLARSTELERLRAVAEEANRAKSAFLAAMSHELRTPLNAIGGYAQLLEMGIHGPITPAQAGALEKVSRSQRHLLRLINEVLNLARIEAGGVTYDLRPIALREIADAVVPMVEPQLAERGLAFALDIPPDLTARADSDKTEQVLLNLLGNAVKFTARGGRVGVRGGVDAGAPGMAFIEVEDTGMGIPADFLLHVFDPFVQVDTSHARRSEGTGLGLAISRDLARGMGGDLSVESVLGVGSIFRLTLPRSPAG